MIDNALRASPLAEIGQNRLVGRTGLFKRVVRRERAGARSLVKFVHNVRPPVPGIRLRGRFSIRSLRIAQAAQQVTSEHRSRWEKMVTVMPLGPWPRSRKNYPRHVSKNRGPPGRGSEQVAGALVQIAGTSRQSLLRCAMFRPEAPRSRLQVQLGLERRDVAVRTVPCGCGVAARCRRS